MMGRLAFIVMHTHNMAIEVWCEETWGERPVRISDWATHDEIVQVLIRLSSSVLIADFQVTSDGVLQIQQHLHIPVGNMEPRVHPRLADHGGENSLPTPSSKHLPLKRTSCSGMGRCAPRGMVDGHAKFHQSTERSNPANQRN